MKNLLINITRNPLINLLVGFIAMLSGLAEMYQQVDHVFTFGAHHGLIVLGLFHALKSLPEVIEGVNKVNESSG